MANIHFSGRNKEQPLKPFLPLSQSGKIVLLKKKNLYTKSLRYKTTGCKAYIVLRIVSGLDHEIEAHISAENQIYGFRLKDFFSLILKIYGNFNYFLKFNGLMKKMNDVDH